MAPIVRRVMRRGGRIAGVGVLLFLAACSPGVGVAPLPPTIEAVGVATDVRIYADHIRFEFADGSVHEVASHYRQLGDGPGFGLVVIGSDAEGAFVATFPTQGGLPPDCYRENGVGIERGDHVELWGVLFAKAPGFPSEAEPALGAEYPAGTRFCLNDRGLVTSIIGPDEPQPVRFDSWTFASDRRSVTVEFSGGQVFDPDNPCSKAYRGSAHATEDELVIGIYPEPFAGEIPEELACTAEGHNRSLAIDLAQPFDGTRVRDVAGQLFFLEEPEGLVELTGLPDGWVEHSGESMSSSPKGRWRRVYAPTDHTPDPGHSARTVELIQSFGAPADVTGGDLQPDVMVNGEAATLYLWPPTGEIVLVWMVGGDGVALVGNLHDFTRDEFIALAESVVATR